MMTRFLIPLTFLAAWPMSLVGQADTTVPVPDGTRISLFFVLVEAHDFGESPAVVRYFADEPLSDLNPIVLVRSRGASPTSIETAARFVLAMMERGLPEEGREIALPVSATPGSHPPAQWAARALAHLRSAEPVDLPGLGYHRTLSFALPASLVREPVRSPPDRDGNRHRVQADTRLYPR